MAAAAVPDRDLLRGTERDDAVPAVPQASGGHEIVTDHRAMGFMLGRRPLALLRERLALDRLQSAEQLATLRSGQLARAYGLVTVRQRPSTANGVLFMAPENETGQVNVILWPGLLEQLRKEALGAALLAVYGVWQAEGNHRQHHRLLHESQPLRLGASRLGPSMQLAANRVYSNNSCPPRVSGVSVSPSVATLGDGSAACTFLPASTPAPFR